LLATYKRAFQTPGGFFFLEDGQMKLMSFVYIGFIAVI
jgi:hypothetical protein